MSVSTGTTTLRMHCTPDASDPSGTRRQAGSVARLILRLERLAEPPPADPALESTVDTAGGRVAPVVDLATGIPTTDTALGRWSAAAAAAQDGCLVLDPQGQVVSLSAAAAELLDCSDGGVIGRRLVDVATFVDFETGQADPGYQDRVPPLACLSSDGIVRSLVRVRHRDDSQVSLDVCGMPLHDAGGRVVGSLSFIRPLSA